MPHVKYKKQPYFLATLAIDDTRMKLMLSLFAVLLSLPAWASVDADLVAARDALNSSNTAPLARAMISAQGDPLAPYPGYWALMQKINTAFAADIEAYLTTYPDGVLAERLRLAWLKQLANGQRWSEFSAQYAQLPVAARDEEVVCDDLLNSAQNTGDKEAIQAARARWLTGRNLPQGCNALFDWLLANDVLTQSEIWQRVRLLLAANQLTLARTISQNTATPLTAAQTNKPTLDNVATPAGRELALYALQLRAKTDIDSARVQLMALSDKLPRADVAYAWGQLGLLAARKLDTISAQACFTRADPTQLSAEQWDAWARTNLRDERWSTLLEVIKAMPEAQRTASRWSYWQGRALKALGRDSEATALFVRASQGSDFYGLLAREALGTYIEQANDNYTPTDKEINAQRAQPAIQRALALFEIANRYQRAEFREDAKREWRWAMRGQDDKILLAAASVAQLAQFYDMAIYSAERTNTLHDDSLRYLAPYREITQRYASQLDLDDAWIYGLIRQESRFVQIARSGVGASGLMQLMPATARWVANKVGLTRFTTNDVDTNLQLGTWYLRHVYDILDGQEVLATAAYNAGPSRARAWQASRPLEGAIYAETIPFSETRDYVQKVMSNAMYYAMVFGHSRIALKDRLGVIPARGVKTAQ